MTVLKHRFHIILHHHAFAILKAENMLVAVLFPSMFSACEVYYSLYVKGFHALQLPFGSRVLLARLARVSHDLLQPSTHEICERVQRL